MIEYNTKILSLNINGLNNPVKRQKIMTKLKKDKSHLSSLESEKLKWFANMNQVIYDPKEIGTQFMNYYRDRASLC